MKSILPLLLLCYCQITFGLSVEELLHKLSQATTPEEEMLTKVELSNELVYSDIKEAEVYINEVFDYSNYSALLPSNFYHHYLVRAWVNQGQGRLEAAHEDLSEAINIAKGSASEEDLLELQINLISLLADKKDTIGIAIIDELLPKLDTVSNKNHQQIWIWTKQLQAKFFSYQDNYQRAFEELCLLQKVGFLDDFPDSKSGIFNSLGIYLQDIGNDEMAESYLKNALQQPYSHDFERKSILFNLVTYYISKSQLDSAEQYMHEARGLFPLSDYERHQFYFLEAKIDFLQGDIDNAINNIEKSNAFLNGTTQYEGVIFNCVVEAEIRTQRKEWRKVQDLLKEANRILKDNPHWKMLDIRTSIAALTVESELALSRPELLPHYYKYKEVLKKVTKQKADQKLKEVLVSFESEQKEKENQLLKQKNQIAQQNNYIQRGWIATLVILLLLTGWSIWLLRKNLQLKEEINEKLLKKNTSLIFAKEELERLNSSLQEKLAKKDTSLEENIETEKISIKFGQKTSLINSTDIQCIEAEEPGAKLVLKNGRYSFTDERLKYLIEKLNPTKFIQIHRSTIVNMDFVESIGSGIIKMIDGKEYNIGKKHKQNIIDALP